MFRRGHAKGFVSVLAVVAAVIFIAVFFTAAAWRNLVPQPRPEFGITFSTVYAERLGLDWRQAYVDALDVMRVRSFRVPVYWSKIEPEKGNYDWSSLDFLVGEAEKRGAKLTLVLGQKVPRWPECFIPEWAELTDKEYAHRDLLATMGEVVTRYRDSEAVEAWQIENEYFFPFGICPPPQPSYLREEIDLVRSLDDHPVVLTVSGELETYLDAAVLADKVGISMYRVTWNDLWGFFLYPLPPSFYRAKAALASAFADEVYISELQAEPWFLKPINDMTPEERVEAFPVGMFKQNVEFATRTGLDRVYLWGYEWWYAERARGETSLWDYAFTLFKE